MGENKGVHLCCDERQHKGCINKTRKGERHTHALVSTIQAQGCSLCDSKTARFLSIRHPEHVMCVNLPSTVSYSC